ncbi:hypothetical protein STRAU_6754 [Streptomyces aurantiacus JA 4570]|uniref:Uncharacterized protein n=1 Tax=Streptomyces aurantiacus JA 4570 TaxID=1286094 RepID=S3ZP98_9ACTN|nr:hypothetical protein STRAU_6754 [Streptomyces aurantiacus JA 4570]
MHRRSSSLSVSGVPAPGRPRTAVKRVLAVKATVRRKIPSPAFSGWARAPRPIPPEPGPLPRPP